MKLENQTAVTPSWGPSEVPMRKEMASVGLSVLPQDVNNPRQHLQI